jgi:hypothetical protein
MTRDEAKATAMAYAWGREDASSIRTVTPPGSEANGDWLFREAYAQGYDDFNAQRRHMMIPVREAYENWQASSGRSVFRPGELTLGEKQRRELRELWPDSWSSGRPGAYDAYYARRDAMQAAAWNALGGDPELCERCGGRLVAGEGDANYCGPCTGILADELDASLAGDAQLSRIESPACDH